VAGIKTSKAIITSLLPVTLSRP